jgi:hypothetical protein
VRQFSAVFSLCVYIVSEDDASHLSRGEFMGKASHKHAGSYITIYSAAPPVELLHLAEMVALQVFKRNPQKPGPIVVTSRTTGSIDFAILNVFKKALLRFRVTATASPRGGTQLRSVITYFRTRQPAVLGFIPAGPKELVAWKAYSTFMNAYKSAVEASDRFARTDIVLAAG